MFLVLTLRFWSERSFSQVVMPALGTEWLRWASSVGRWASKHLFNCNGLESFLWRIKMKKILTAPCGLVCFNCEFHESNITEELIQTIHENWGDPKETIACQGCSHQNGKRAEKDCLMNIGNYSLFARNEKDRSLWRNGRLLATGECCDFDYYQKDYTDVGLIVDESMREKGLGAKLFKYLIGIAESRGLKLICSTEKITIGAQKAINRAGFISANRILQFDL
jgi:GNAT superfamily N-acetyltransferase